MAPLRLPSTAEELTPELLTDALSERHPGVAVDGLEVIDTGHCNSGSASTAGRVVPGLTYAPGRGGGLPNRVVLETMPIQPGAPAAMYENEVRFYRDLRPELDVELRRGHERELLTHTLEQLRRRGVQDVPDPDAAWLL